MTELVSNVVCLFIFIAMIATVLYLISRFGRSEIFIEHGRDIDEGVRKGRRDKVDQGERHHK